MIDIEQIFRYKTPIPDKLLEHGFTYADGIYKKSLPIGLYTIGIYRF